MSKTMIMDHPLVQHKVSLLRNKNTGTKEFKELVCELATLLCYEATRDLPTEEVEIETPIAVAKTRMLSGRKLALVPILRAGLGMVVDIYVAAQDEKLNENGYIVPGLGDAGDRIFGTK